MARRPYSTARWQRLRKVQLSKEPLCRYCSEQGRVTMATDVDHIVPIAAGGEAYDEGNLQSLCRSCHSSAKQREDKTGERIGCDVHGIPLRGWD